MSKNYNDLVKKVKKRLNPENISFQRTLNEDLATISYSDLLMYVRFAMNAVPPEYTAKSKEAGEMVKKHLGKELVDVVYKYQGSVMTDTHIKGASDIDLLVITDKSYRIESVLLNNILTDFLEKQKYNHNQIEKLEREATISTYQGDGLDDLRGLRLDSETILKRIYQECDITKPKAIKINNLHLKREVDTVIANWYDNIDSIVNDKGLNRGVQVYNKDKHARGDSSFPFLSISKINNKNSLTNRRLKKMIRFLKNLKEDSNHKIDLNSFEINAICYDIDMELYIDKSFYELVSVIYNQLKSISTNPFHADRIISVDGTETIFEGKPDKIKQLKLVLAEVENIYLDLIVMKKVI
ncbi:nucleotidyltransferase domain-containing protein [Tenacibaculum finnmarkense]|uniref:nucleotidyltransferase domain-containing protein n=1 Tax=Tenacibaculum finnmarkense TaxID=2781243 RepID=UPI000C4868E7|nr:nucleotidyltransferase domain-containing protein [Tenacibaculum finnmarkense]MCD8438440.1 nucleotidyltransferase domain-containing protein [Tenacibaculum finnmarkense genomovar ulcerans]MCG8719375.1 hypothetical protein [Tenacibaculum finnmarkense]SOS53775.1 conserved hypothetical protein [Tenacibaculum finnmarkense]